MIDEAQKHIDRAHTKQAEAEQDTEDTEITSAAANTNTDPPNQIQNKNKQKTPKKKKKKKQKQKKQKKNKQNQKKRKSKKKHNHNEVIRLDLNSILQAKRWVLPTTNCMCKKMHLTPSYLLKSTCFTWPVAFWKFTQEWLMLLEPRLAFGKWNWAQSMQK